MQTHSTLAADPSEKECQKSLVFSPSAAATTTVSLVFCRKQLPPAFLPPAESWMRGSFLFGLGLPRNADCRLGEGSYQRDPWFVVMGCRWVQKTAKSAAFLLISQRWLAHRSGASVRFSAQSKVLPAHDLSSFHPSWALQTKPRCTWAQLGSESNTHGGTVVFTGINSDQPVTVFINQRLEL